MSSSSNAVCKKLVYNGSVYILARTQEDIALDRVGEIAAKIAAVTKEEGDVIHKRDRIGNLLTEMTLHLKVLGLRSPLV